MRNKQSVGLGMKTAWISLRYTEGKRFNLFLEGIKKHGFRVKTGIPQKKVRQGDVFITWNRISSAHRAAGDFAKKGGIVLVAENASFGNDFVGEKWFHISHTFHNSSGRFPIGDNDRWDLLNVDLKTFRKEGGETVILPQRGIGCPGIAMPKSWPVDAKKLHPKSRTRPHPGKNKIGRPLLEDLENASTVVTWGSGAALKALMEGIRVISYMPNWIGEQDNTEHGRLNMFRRLVWAQWTHKEIKQGYPFERLLNHV